jgi:class I fructose-bisphosphate aldolase
MSGKQIRLQRIFAQDARAVVIAMDHGLPGMSPLAALGQPGQLIDAIAAGGADAILTTPGVAAHFAPHIGRLGLVMRLDGGATTLSTSFGEMQLIASVEDALKAGADAVAVMGFCGTEDESSSLKTLGQVAVECRRLGVPLMAEMLPLGYQGKPTAAQVATAARIGAEMGADIIKTKYVGPPEGFQAVTEACFVPVLMLGGSARSFEGLLDETRDALKVGVAGVAIGRNVWQADDVTGATRALVEVVHRS